jgi:uncharacterized protein with ACT and thioredoxin-like domain
MAAQGIYLLRAIEDEKVFDNLCETLEEFGVEIVSPSIFSYELAQSSETELVISSTEETLEDLKEELESQDLVESVNIVDSFEEKFDEYEEDEYEEDGL